MKKGDISASTLIGIILLIIGFSIVLFFYYNLNAMGIVDKNVCHQSVIYRGSLTSRLGIKEFAPLKCKTEKICITSGGVLSKGDCGFENTQGVTYVKIKTKTDVEKAIANNIIDCWEMMGEGKLEVFTASMAQMYGIGGIGSSCVICNRIAFDKSKLTATGIDLNNVNVRDYMMTHAPSGKNVSYMEYFAGKKGLLSVKDNLEISDVSLNEAGLISNKKTSVSINEQPSTENKEIAVMFMQISSPTVTDVLKNDLIALGVVGVGGFAAIPKFGSLTTSVLTKNPYVTAVLAIVGVGLQQGSVLYSQSIAAGKCGDISIGDEARYGCSVVRIIDYGSEDVSNYCSVIESIA